MADHEGILNLWANGALSPDISKFMGIPRSSVTRSVCAARKRDDPRAVRRNHAGGRHHRAEPTPDDMRMLLIHEAEVVPHVYREIRRAVPLDTVRAAARDFAANKIDRETLMRIITPEARA